MNRYGFRLATIADLPDVLTIVEDAKRRLARHQSGQWQDGNPSQETLVADIRHHQLYVAIDGQVIIGMLAVLDDEPAYKTLESGAWHRHGSYLVIHRFATSEVYLNKGVGTFMISQVEKLAKNRLIPLIRIDTHDKNLEMKALILKCGFYECGTTLIDGTKLRTVYEKFLYDTTLE